MGVFIDSDPTADFFGEDVAWPFEENVNGDLKVVQGLACLEQGLWTPVATLPGEVKIAPLLGLDFSEHQNAPNVGAEHLGLRADLLGQYQREDRIDDVTVEIVADEDSAVAQIKGVAKDGSPVGVDVPLVSP